MSIARSILEQFPKRDAAGCIVIAGNQVLLLQRSANSFHEPLKWGVPGGRIELGETPWQAAVRETLEEATVELSQYTPDSSHQQITPNEGATFTTFVYRFRSSFINNNPVIIDHENEDWGWFMRKEVENLDLHIGVEELMDLISF